MPPEAQPGFLHVTLSGIPLSGALLSVQGPGVDSIRAADGRLFAGDSDPRRVLVVGPFNPGDVIDFWVPDVAAVSDYRVVLEEASDLDFAPANPVRFSLSVTR